MPLSIMTEDRELQQPLLISTPPLSPRHHSPPLVHHKEDKGAFKE